MKKIYDSIRTTRAALTMLLMGLLMFAANNLLVQTLKLDKPDKDYAPDETVFITGTGFQANEFVSLNTLSI